MTDIYRYHPYTGEFQGRSEARMDPLESGRPLVPANATLEAPPEALEGHARVFDGAAWTQVEDHRGESVYNKADASGVSVDWLGEIGPEYTDQEPGDFPIWDEQAGAWTTDADARDEAIIQARETEILADLDRLDAATVRPMRAVLAAEQDGDDPDAEDLSRLAALEAQAVALRAELSGLR